MDFINGGGVLNCFQWYRLVLDEGKVYQSQAMRRLRDKLIETDQHILSETGPRSLSRLCQVCRQIFDGA
jgi:hypothetical protein